MEAIKGAGAHCLHIRLNDEELNILDAICDMRGEEKRTTMMKVIMKEEWKRIEEGVENGTE